MLHTFGQILLGLASLALLVFVFGPTVPLARRLFGFDDLDNEDDAHGNAVGWSEPGPSESRRSERARESGLCGICGAEPGGWLKRLARGGLYCPECEGWYCQRHVIESVTYHPPWRRRLREVWFGSSKIRHRCVYCGHEWTRVIHASG